MTPEQQILVQTSFAKVAPIADLAASLFYEPKNRSCRLVRSTILLALRQPSVVDQAGFKRGGGASWRPLR